MFDEDTEWLIVSRGARLEADSYHARLESDPYCARLESDPYCR